MVNNNWTFNQIAAKLEEVATNHQLIADFGKGDTWEIGASAEQTYPLMWVVPLPGSFVDKVVSLNWRLLFMDLVNKDENNEYEVLSDTFQLGMDTIAILSDPQFANDWRLARGVTFEPFTEKGDDQVAGWSFSITFELKFLRDRCQVPLSSPITKLWID